MTWVLLLYVYTNYVVVSDRLFFSDKTTCEATLKEIKFNIPIAHGTCVKAYLK
jgi:hypothetical protein